MSARLVIRQSSQARWSRRIALFAAQLLLLAAILHRFEAINAAVATTLLTIGIGAALVAFVLGCSAFHKIWSYGQSGSGRAIAGLMISMLTLVVPAWYLPNLIWKPRLTDIRTSFDTPLRFEALAARQAGAEAASDPSDVDKLSERQQAQLQAAAYPEVRPMRLEKSPTQSFDLVREAVAQLGWKIVASEAPEADEPGRIEAVAKTPIMGFADDVVILVSLGGGEARIDVRSASRYGQHDFGTNAGHIKQLFAQIETGLEEGEKLAREIALAKRAEELREVREERLAEERAMREEREAREREELLRLMREQTQIARPAPPPSEPGRARASAPNVQVRRAAPRRRGWAADPHRFWQRFQD